MGFYAGIDLHSRNSYVGVLDHEDKRIFRKKLANDPEVILSALNRFRSELVGIVIESTFNWYWLVDALMEDGFRVHLANPSAIKKYEGLKHSDDHDDAFWLAQMLRLGILPEGYIYPKEERPIRDLLRKRSHLVRIRTSLMLSLQNIVERNCGQKLNANVLRKTTEDEVCPLLVENEDLHLSGKVSKECMDFLTGQIRCIERSVYNKIRIKDQYKYLQTMPGVGQILSLTIMLETGPIERFPHVGKYASYCRKVPSKWISNGKQKGKGNRKNGNKYLAWAYSEAAEMARRFNVEARTFYNRKAAKSNVMVARGALAHKLVRAGFYVMRDCVPFDSGKAFA